MSSSRFRRPLALAASVAVGALVALSGPGVAGASHAGDGGGLLTGSGNGKIVFPDGHGLTLPGGINDASWSPDGNRAVYLDNNGAIFTVRHDEGFDAEPKWIVGADSDGGTQRSHPTWLGSEGADLAWAENQSGQWMILIAISTAHCCLDGDDFGDFGAHSRIPIKDGYQDTHPDGGDSDLVVFQRQPRDGSAAAVWVYDPSANPQTRLVISNAEQPAISPDGSRVAFVRQVGGSRLIFTSDLSGGDVDQVTTAGDNPVSHTNPAWSPDGQTIAFNTSALAVATVPADGSAVPSSSRVTGLPAYQPAAKNFVARLAGSSRFGTAGAVSQTQWATHGDASDKRQKAQSVVLSRSDQFADALGGATLAAAKQGPLLLTQPNMLNPITKAEIERVLAPGATVYVLGGAGAVSAAVEDQLKASGYRVDRRSGANRYETSVAIADAVMNYDPASGQPRDWPAYVLTATGVNFPDALAAAAAAGSFNTPGSDKSAVILLTQDTKLPTATKQYLDGWVAAHPGDGPWAIGGPAAIASGTYHTHEIIGSNRYQTSLYVAHHFFGYYGGNTVVGVATGTNWPDALAGGALMATLDGPLLLTPGTSTTLSPYTAYVLDASSGSYGTAFVFGGTGAVNGALTDQIGDLISGPGGFVNLTVTESGSLVGAPTLRSTAGDRTGAPVRE